MIKAIIFDCFGVVYGDNFDSVWVGLGGDLERDQEFIKNTFYESHTGRITSTASIFAKHLGVSEEEFRRANDEGRGIDRSMLAFIKGLKRDYKIGMLSNIGSGGLGKYIPRETLDEHFDVVIESAQIGFAKPEPNAYEITAQRLGVRLDKCVFIDDRPEYVEGAAAVGMKAIVYQNLEQLKEDLAKALA